MGLVCGKPGSDVPLPSSSSPKLRPKTISEEESAVSITDVQLNQAKCVGNLIHHSPNQTQPDGNGPIHTNENQNQNENANPTNTNCSSSSSSPSPSPSPSPSSPTPSSPVTIPIRCPFGRIERFSSTASSSASSSSSSSSSSPSLSPITDYFILLPLSRPHDPRWEFHLFVDQRSVVDGTDYIHGDGETQVKIRGKLRFREELTTVDLGGGGGDGGGNGKDQRNGNEKIENGAAASGSYSPLPLNPSHTYVIPSTPVEIQRVGMLRVIEELSFDLHIKDGAGSAPGIGSSSSNLLLQPSHQSSLTSSSSPSTPSGWSFKGSASWRVEQREPEYKVIVVPPSPVVASSPMAQALSVDGVEVEMDLDHEK